MRFFKAAVLAFAGLTLATPVPMEDEMVERGEEVVEHTLTKRANPSVSGLKFNIDGSTSYFVGTNTYWIGFLTNNADVDTVMSHLQSTGIKVLRVWGKKLRTAIFNQNTNNYQDSMMLLRALPVSGFSPSSRDNNHKSILEPTAFSASIMWFLAPSLTGSN